MAEGPAVLNKFLGSDRYKCYWVTMQSPQQYKAPKHSQSEATSRLPEISHLKYRKTAVQSDTKIAMPESHMLRTLTSRTNSVK